MRRYAPLRERATARDAGIPLRMPITGLRLSASPTIPATLPIRPPRCKYASVSLVKPTNARAATSRATAATCSTVPPSRAARAAWITAQPCASATCCVSITRTSSLGRSSVAICLARVADWNPPLPVPVMQTITTLSPRAATRRSASR